MTDKPKTALVPIERIEDRILVIRGQKVLIDADLATLYGITTKRLNEQVRRNKERFPADFMFHLTAEEKAEVVATCDHLAKLKFAAALPHAFTEYGAIMAASVLNTPLAVEASIYVVRAFVRLREILATNQELAQKLDQLEKKITTHDQAIVGILKAIRELMTPATPAKKRKIGFVQEEG